MISKKQFDKATLIGLVLLIFGIFSLPFIIKSNSIEMISYEDKVFDDTYIHNIDIEIKDFDELIEHCFDELYRPGNITIDGEKFYNVGIRAKGNSSMENVVQLGSIRHSFKIEFDHYDESKRYYGLDKLVLNNLESDYTYMKDYLVFKLMAETGADAPLCSYSFITINGEPWGLYISIESIEDSMLTRLYGRDYGNLYKPEYDDMMVFRNRKNILGTELSFSKWMDYRSPIVRLEYVGDDIKKYRHIFDWAKTPVTTTDKHRLIKTIKQLNNGENIENIVDTENMLRFFAVHTYVYNEDGYNGSAPHNYYLYEKDGKILFLPWDYGLAYGCFLRINASRVINDPIDTPIFYKQDGFVRPMFDWVVNNTEYKEKYHQYLKELLDYLEEIDIENRIDSLANMMYPYLEKQKVEFCTPEEFRYAVKNLKEFFRLRTISIKAQLDGKLSTTFDTRKEDGSDLIDTSTFDILSLGYRERNGWSPE